MPNCDQCGAQILFGGVRRAGLHFCKEKCANASALLSVIESLPDERVKQALNELWNEGVCPRCGQHAGSGLDVHEAHEVWSAIFLTSWRSVPAISCKACGIKRQLASLLFSGVLGWWGMPWGILVTPIQITRNLAGMLRGSSVGRPSAELEMFVRRTLAAETLANRTAG